MIDPAVRDERDHYLHVFLSTRGNTHRLSGRETAPLELKAQCSVGEILDNWKTEAEQMAAQKGLVYEWSDRPPEIRDLIFAEYRYKSPYGSEPAATSQIQPRTWDDFLEHKLLWFVNRMLHILGWAIVVECSDNGKVEKVYPARVTFRGFDHSVEEAGFKRISQYLEDNASQLNKEAHE